MTCLSPHLPAVSATGAKLIEAVTQIAKEKNWSVLRWITAENNYPARNTYDKVATQTKWVTYDIKL